MESNTSSLVSSEGKKYAIGKHIVVGILLSVGLSLAIYFTIGDKN